jgi:hypothetical protein
MVLSCALAYIELGHVYTLPYSSPCPRPRDRYIPPPGPLAARAFFMGDYAHLAQKAGGERRKA